MGMNFQDVIRDVHDPANHQLKVAASVSASNQVTVTPQQAWPDPKTFIGLVTAVGNFSASLGGNVTLNPSPNFIGIVTVANPGSAALSGNVTLDPGSKTQIIGNITLSSSPNFIGIVTVANSQVNTGNVTINPGPNQIGSVTVSHPVSLGAGVANIGFMTVTTTNPGALGGNVTLDAGSKTQIVGNVTLSDSKGYIGLVTVTQASSARTITGNMTLSDAKTYIGLTTTTLGISDRFIGLVTVVQSSAARTITGNVTLSDSKTNIGLVTLSGGTAWTDPKTYIGLVTATLAGSVNTGMTTIFPGPNFIGLTTTVLGNLEKAEDAAHTSGDKGVMALVVRHDNLGTITSDDGDYAPLSVNSDGELYATVSGSLNSVDSIGEINAVNANVRVNGETAHDDADANPPVKIGGYAKTTAPTAVSADGDRVNAWFDLNGRQAMFLSGNVTLSDPKNFIGLVTVVQSSTVRSITGNLTLSDSKGFIGLVTTVAGRPSSTAYQPVSIGNISIALASLTNGSSRQSSMISNPSQYYAAIIYTKVFTGTTAPTINTFSTWYLLRGDNPSSSTYRTDGAGGADAAITIRNASILGTTALTSLPSTPFYAEFDTAPLGPLGPEWGIAFNNGGGQTLNTVEANFLKEFVYYTPTNT